MNLQTQPTRYLVTMNPINYYVDIGITVPL
jgi:hypothetical protein